ncbi:MAG: GspMb/PilO family protein [Terrimicrobiaceae bacterium]
MRKLATNELRLLIFFCSAIFLALNLFAVRAWTGARASLVREAEAARGRVAESRMWIDGASGLSSSHEWIKAHPPQTIKAEEASAGLLQMTRSAAEEAGLKIVEENLLPSAATATGTAASLQAKLSGPFPGVAKFLFALQNPTAWRSVPKLIIRSDTEPPNVLVDMEVHQYYLPATQNGP